MTPMNRHVRVVIREQASAHGWSMPRLRSAARIRRCVTSGRKAYSVDEVDRAATAMGMTFSTLLDEIRREAPPAQRRGRRGGTGR